MGPAKIEAGVVKFCFLPIAIIFVNRPRATARTHPWSGAECTSQFPLCCTNPNPARTTHTQEEARRERRREVCGHASPCKQTEIPIPSPCAARHASKKKRGGLGGLPKWGEIRKGLVGTAYNHVLIPPWPVACLGLDPSRTGGYPFCWSDVEIS